MDNEFLLTPFFLDSSAPLLDRLAKPGWAVNRPAIGGSNQAARIGAIHTPLAEWARAAAAAGRRSVTIGGDCLQTAAVLAELRRAGMDPVIVWLDAHGDFNTPETSPSGFIGGMPLAMLVGRGDAWLRDNISLPAIAERDIIVSDARDLDPGEAANLADFANRARARRGRHSSSRAFVAPGVRAFRYRRRRRARSAGHDVFR